MFPTRHGGQHLKMALPTMFSIGRKPQVCESRLKFLLSPKTITMPSGTVFGPHVYSAAW